MDEEEKELHQKTDNQHKDATMDLSYDDCMLDCHGNEVKRWTQMDQLYEDSVVQNFKIHGRFMAIRARQGDRRIQDGWMLHTKVKGSQERPNFSKGSNKRALMKQ